MKAAFRWVERVLLWVSALAALAALIAFIVIVSRPSEKGGAQPTFAGADLQQKRLVVFLDGTWNSIDSNTNVWRMRALTAVKDNDGRPQLIYYGVGVNGFLGGVFGQGLDDNIRLAYEWLIENYNDKDEIFIFGFSRGAFTARSLAGLVAINGILKAGSPIGTSELFKRYKKGDEESIWKLREAEQAGNTSMFTDQERWLLKYSQPASVKMIGVWDTVGSLGLSTGKIPGISRSSFDYLQTGLRIHILNGYHALAIDEHREDFAPTLWDVRRSNNPKDVFAAERPLASVEQRWFVGAHANVGGGYETDLLAQAPLRWIMDKAQSHGLKFRSTVEFDGDALKASTVDSYALFGRGFYKLISSPLYRTIGQNPEMRADGSHTNVNETIDVSVFDRWRADPSYRPQNLTAWAERKNMDPSQIRTSVRADDPMVAVPE